MHRHLIWQILMVCDEMTYTLKICNKFIERGSNKYQSNIIKSIHVSMTYKLWYGSNGFSNWGGNFRVEKYSQHRWFCQPIKEHLLITSKYQFSNIMALTMSSRLLLLVAWISVSFLFPIILTNSYQYAWICFQNYFRSSAILRLAKCSAVKPLQPQQRLTFWHLPGRYWIETCKNGGKNTPPKSIAIKALETNPSVQTQKHCH